MAKPKTESKVAEGIEQTLLVMLQECKDGRKDGDGPPIPLMADEKLEIIDRALKFEALNRRIPPEQYGSNFEPDDDEGGL